MTTLDKKLEEITSKIWVDGREGDGLDRRDINKIKALLSDTAKHEHKVAMAAAHEYVRNKLQEE